MQKVALYLKTPLFALKGCSDPVPSKAIIIEGTILEEGKGGIRLETSAYYSVESKSPSEQERRHLKGSSIKLFVPSGKIDHMRFL